MSVYEVNKETFSNEIKDHKLNIKLDQGVYRHIYCAMPNTICQSFNIVTTPGYLMYYGDMGSFTFSRTEDMFRFFRREGLSINEGYWAEKLEAIDRIDGYKEFVWDEFEACIKKYIEDEDDPDRNKEIQDFINQKLYYVDQDEFGAVNFVREFDEDNELGVSLQDFWGVSYKVPTTRYLWACFAIVWTIQQYDKLKADTND